MRINRNRQFAPDKSFADVGAGELFVTVADRICLRLMNPTTGLNTVVLDDPLQPATPYLTQSQPDQMVMSLPLAELNTHEAA